MRHRHLGHEGSGRRKETKKDKQKKNSIKTNFNENNTIEVRHLYEKLSHEEKFAKTLLNKALS